VDVDRRTDVYSLGVMLYELACSQVPFDAENPLGILTQHMYVAPIPPNERDPEGRKVPVGLEAIILKCLSKNPDHRYGSMQDLYDDLQRVERGQVPEAVADLLSRGSDELPLNRLRSAAQAAPIAIASSEGVNWVGIALTSLLVVTLFAVVFFPLNSTLFGNDAVVVTDTTASESQNTSSAKPMYTVALVLSPIDAHVFDGKDDLGTMPISIQLEQGEVATVEVRREGFSSQKALIDGTRSKLIIQLEPMPGADLTALPTTAGHPSLQADAGTRIVKLGSAATAIAATAPATGPADGGARRPRKPSPNKSAAETPTTPSPSAPPGLAPPPVESPTPPTQGGSGGTASPQGGHLEPIGVPLDTPAAEP
jgi:serine/threonine-protein kinase